MQLQNMLWGNHRPGATTDLGQPPTWFTSVPMTRSFMPAVSTVLVASEPAGGAVGMLHCLPGPAQPAPAAGANTARAARSHHKLVFT